MCIVCMWNSDISILQGIEIMEEWFRVDARPFKQALLNIIKRWSYMFKQHLMDHVTNRLVLCVEIQYTYIQVFVGASNMISLTTSKQLHMVDVVH